MALELVLWRGRVAGIEIIGNGECWIWISS